MEVRALLTELQFGARAVRFVPVSSLQGINLTVPATESALCEWYQGPTLLELMNTFKEPPRLVRHAPLPVLVMGLDVIVITMYACDMRCDCLVLVPGEQASAGHNYGHPLRRGEGNGSGCFGRIDMDGLYIACGYRMDIVKSWFSPIEVFGSIID